MKKIDEVFSKRDFTDILDIFIEEDVKFMIIGGVAIMLHGYVRLTEDLDLWVWANPENAAKIVKALIKFGAPMENISEEDFEKEEMIIQLGVKPIRIDVTTKIEGITFEEAYPNAQKIEIDGKLLPVISINDLIKNKKASGRKKDLIDVERLEKIQKAK